MPDPDDTLSAHYRVLRGIGMAGLTVSHSFRRLANATEVLVGAALHEVMAPRARERFSMELYSRATQAREIGRGLPRWEAEWFERDLPPAPARVLIAALGTGREALPLIEAGYEIIGFDGAPASVAVSQAILGRRAEILGGSYAQLCAAVEGSLSPLRHLAERRYDAVLLGWGSLTHVAGADERRRVLEAVTKLTDGPVLASFYVVNPRHRQGRATRVGRWLGRMLSQGNMERSEATFTSWGGFAEFLTREEVDSLGATVGRRVSYYEADAPFPYVTFHARAMP